MSKAEQVMLTDADSRRAIREELRTNFLVEAGAGSGKTQMLAERMAAGIASGDYEIQHLAAVTFTRKAASELRGRFHLALERRRSELLGRPDLQVGRDDGPVGRSADQQIARLDHALGNLERFFAGTIHSFCARLLRERPVESGVSPGFTELDEVQDEELRNRAWRDFVANMRAAGDPDMLALLDTGVKPHDLDSAVVSTNEDVEFPPGDGVCPDPKPAWEALQKFWTALQKLLPKEIDSETTCKIQQAAEDYRRKLRVASKRLDRASTIADLLGTWDKESKIVQKWWADSAAEKKRFKEAVEPLHGKFCEEVVNPFLSGWRQYVYRLSVGLLTRAREYASLERRRHNSLNYGDLLILTAKVLRENAEVRRALQRKYRHLFVDEFQDTDPIQAEIVFLLAADEELVGPTFRSGDKPESQTSSPEVSITRSRAESGEQRIPDWRTVSVRSGALFVVGDPKQSIYRFRRADIEIYNTVRARFSDPSVGRVLPLTTNFRSVPQLCEWANEVFKGEFPAEPTQHSPRFAPLDPKPIDTTPPGGLFTLTYDGDAKAVRAEDADRIARYIRSEVNAGRRRYSDFLILTRKKKAHIAPYAAALEALNVPIEVSGAGAFGESEQVHALTMLLRALADPQDPLPLIAVLRGPFFGISDPQLYAFKQAGGWFSIWHGLDTTEGTSVAHAFLGPSAVEGRPASAGPAENALLDLRRYYHWTRMLPAAAALDRILEHTGYLALAATTPGGVEAGDLLHAVDRVRQVFEDGGSLADAADALEADSEFTTEVESLPLEPGRTDVVRLMNLHKAKGLEANVVFLADPCGGMKPRVDVHVKREGNQALGWFQVEKKFESGFGGKLLGEHADWESHAAAELPFLEAEEKRLFYVAATRAREMLVVSRHAGGKGNAWGPLNVHLAGAKELNVPATVAAVAPVALDCSPQVQANAHAARVLQDQRINQPAWSVTSVTAEAKGIKRRPHVEPNVEGDATRVVAQTSSAHRADAGFAWGTLIHGLLEHAMRHPAATREDLRRLAGWLTVETLELRDVIETALDTVAIAAKADFWPIATEARHSVETPFVSAQGKDLTNGVIDLVFERADGWMVIDYKTDRTIDEGKYRQQLDAYRSALTAVGCVVADASVVPVRTDSV